MATEPDLAGFLDAQARLRQEFAEDVTFLGEVTLEYPAGTALDPESGEPFDPVIEPTASAQASAVLPCEVAHRVSLVRDRESQAGPFGFAQTGNVVLVTELSYEPTIRSMSHALVQGERYEIRAVQHDGVRGPDRLLVYGAQEPG